jgi:hypothetical protein
MVSLLAMVMLCGTLPMVLPMTAVAATEKSGDDGTTNWDFIEPVTHQKTVPSGYTGIYTAQELDNVRYASGKYILMNDIDLSGWGNLEPIDYFDGYFDGNGYTVKNMTIDFHADASELSEGEDICIGLFGVVRNSVYVGETQVSVTVVENIGLLNAKINVDIQGIAEIYYGYGNAQVYVGGLIGWNILESPIENCFVTGEINISGESQNIDATVGGILGAPYASSGIQEITDCYSAVNINDTSSYAYCVGGIVGNSAKTFRNCYNTGNIKTSNADYCGGITASASLCSFYDCYNTGNITCSSTAYDIEAGGIIGSSSVVAEINNCYNTGNIWIIASDVLNGIADAFAGGIVGSNSGTFISGAKIINCYNEGSIRAEVANSEEYTHFLAMACAGGILGVNYNSSGGGGGEALLIEDCYNRGSLYAFAYSSGNGHDYATGDIVASGKYNKASSGTLGNDLEWRYATSNKNLRIYTKPDNFFARSAPIPDNISTTAPWLLSPYNISKSSIEQLDVNYYVTKIGDSSFENYSGLKQLKVEEPSVYNYTTTIGKWAFRNCYNLTRADLGKNVTFIDDEAFAGCSQLVIHCWENSYAHQWALAHGFSVQVMKNPETDKNHLYLGVIHTNLRIRYLIFSHGILY